MLAILDALDFCAASSPSVNLCILLVVKSVAGDVLADELDDLPYLRELRGPPGFIHVRSHVYARCELIGCCMTLCPWYQLFKVRSLFEQCSELWVDLVLNCTRQAAIENALKQGLWTGAEYGNTCQPPFSDIPQLRMLCWVRERMLGLFGFVEGCVDQAHITVFFEDGKIVMLGWPHVCVSLRKRCVVEGQVNGLMVFAMIIVILLYIDYLILSDVEIGWLDIIVALNR